jgi:hypothetical protein
MLARTSYESDAGAGVKFSPETADFESRFEKLMEEFFEKKNAAVKEIRGRYIP